jgi:HlyD family secretion protein
VDEEPSLRRIVIIGLLAISACFGGFGGWALLARLNSAASAPGIVVVDSHRKTVQHLEGGILRELLVREGELVKSGQPLALLDTTQAEAQHGQLTSQQVTLQARISRLRAEQQNQRTFTIPPELAGRLNEPLVAEAVEAQRRLFEARWRAYDSASAIVTKRIQQFREQITSAQSQLQAVEKRLSLVQEDLRNATFLYDRGYEKRTRLLELQRNIEELNGQASQQRGVIAQAQQSIAGSEMEIVNLGDSRHAEVAKDLEDSRAQEVDLADRIRAARDVLDRREILSPQDGIVTDVRLVTPGGVIGPGQPLMDIVPVDDPLIIEARVRPDDIDVVHPGLAADVYLTAFKRSSTPPVEGAVTYVSADMLTDPRDNTKYFLARVKPSEKALAQLQGLTLSPGMPADVMIVTGERKAFQYFIEPLSQRMRHAFRED